jgi:hypothetical protein
VAASGIVVRASITTIRFQPSTVTALSCTWPRVAVSCRWRVT